MQKTADKLGVFLTAYFAKWNDFAKKEKFAPLICQIQKNNQFHFVVVYKRNADAFLVADPWQEELVWIKNVEFAKMYTGVVLASQKGIYLTNEKDSDNKSSFIFWNSLAFELLISFLLSILVAAFVILHQFFLKIIIDEVLVKQISAVVTTILLGFLVLFFNKLVLKIFLNVVVSKIEVNFKKKWNLKFFNQVYQLHFNDYQKYKTQLLLQNYRYFNEVLHFYFPVSFQILESVFTFFFSFLVLIFFNITMVLPVFFLISLNLIICFLFLPWFRKVNQLQINHDKKLQSQVIEFFHNYLTYKQRNLLHLPLFQIQSEIDSQTKTFYQKTSLNNLEITVYQIFNFFATIVVVYLLLNLDQDVTLAPGSFVFLFALVNNLITKSSGFFHSFVYWTKLQEPKKQVDAFLFSQEMTKVGSGTGFFLRQIESIELQKINFSYDQNDQIWKDNLSLKINKNLVVHGSSGVGKTTLLQILANNLKHCTGTILINGKVLKQINNPFYQKHIYFLSASTPLLPGTVLNNIVNWNQSKGFIQIWKKANIDYFCQKINLDPGSWVSNETVSNGQRQIINFLSAFFCQEKIILLDESLNSVNLQWKIELLSTFLAVKQKSFIFYTTHDQNIDHLFEQKLCLISSCDEK